MEKKKNKMKKTVLLVSCVLLVVLTGIWSADGKRTAEICGEKGCVNVEIAENKEKGLSGRESGNMLFIFEEEKKHGIWMKDMNYELDIVWINANWTVTRVEKGELCQEECQVYHGKGKYVLELEKGTAEKTGIMEKTRLII